MSKRRERSNTPPSDSPVHSQDDTTDEEDEPSLQAPADLTAEQSEPDHPDALTLQAFVAPWTTPCAPTPESPGTHETLEHAAWAAPVRALLATHAVFAADPVQTSGVASTSTTTHSYRPQTRSETHRLALREEKEATINLLAFEAGAQHDQYDRQQDNLYQCTSENLVILDLPASRILPDISKRKRLETIYTYEFKQICPICNQLHPQLSRGTGNIMGPFIGARFEIITHRRTQIPPPTSFWTNEQYKSGEYDQYATTYGHRSQGIYLTPLAPRLVTGAPPWDINFRFLGCDGMREWKLRVNAEEVLSTLLTALWLCKVAGDDFATMSLWTTWWALSVGPLTWKSTTHFFPSQSGPSSTQDTTL
jgi:hypothetical protein